MKKIDKNPFSVHQVASVCLLVVALIVSAAVAMFFVRSQQDLRTLKKELSTTQQQLAVAQKQASQQSQSEAQQLVSEVGQLTVLPTGENPTIATVADLSKLQGQPFFDQAQVGDKVLIYTSAKKRFSTGRLKIR